MPRRWSAGELSATDQLCSDNRRKVRTRPADQAAQVAADGRESPRAMTAARPHAGHAVRVRPRPELRHVCDARAPKRRNQAVPVELAAGDAYMVALAELDDGIDWHI
jgi:hypothetical protein